MQTSFTAANPAFEQRVKDSFSMQQAMKTIGATIRNVQPGKVSIGMPFSDELTQQHGFIHGGIVATLLDSACGYAAFSLMPENAAVLTIEFKINLLLPAKGDWFEAVGRVKKPGRNISVSEGELYAYEGENKKLVASMVGTMMSVYDREGIEH
ncbi:MAG: PaaI family thioesterase [Proteobacteria bacterium]|nr:PaaI family thioesterase [Pseudomonadota bacterium]MCH8177302.1 PaaI family thioesterase [Pseudomonadota bacterium]